MTARLDASRPTNQRLTITDDLKGDQVEFSLHSGEYSAQGGYIWITIDGKPYGIPMSRRERVALRNFLNNNEPT
jgi:hypothetical protein